MAMQLDEVEGIVIRDALERLDILVDKHPDALAVCRQIGRTLTDITTRLRPEDKAHQVDTQCLHLTDVLRIAHATDLNEKGTFSLSLLTFG